MIIEQEIEQLTEELIKAVQKCIEIRSVKDVEHTTPGAPFGPGIRQALEWSLALGESMGFNVKNVDGYAGHIEMGSGELLAILGHLDVVPEGDGWTVPPYGGTIKDKRIYGRGALDDKGPSIAALFAMKAIKDANIPLHKRVRLILGTDEESGWADMKYYFQREEIPSMGFAPDAEFPVIHAEKGMLHLALSKNYSDLPHIILISGGERVNVVPDVCRVSLQGLDQNRVQSTLDHFGLPEGVSGKIEKQGNILELVFRGLGAHGSLPQKGKNAVVYALRFLATLPLSAEEISLLNWVLEHPGAGYYGEGLNLALEDEASGKLSLNLGLFTMTPKRLRLVLDIRYPVSFQKEDIINPVEKAARSANYSLEILTEHAPHYVPKDSPLVQALLKAYADVTGLEPFAFAIGGGTYAKTMPQGVAFGPLLPGEPEVIHCPDEYIGIDNLMLSVKIYAQAILNLAAQ
ncbi:MAG: dipeptidase PepV [Desulfitobacteriaceae bacterium]